MLCFTVKLNKLSIKLRAYDFKDCFELGNYLRDSAFFRGFSCKYLIYVWLLSRTMGMINGVFGL